MTPELSRRAAKSLAPLLMNGSARLLFANTVEKAASFATLPEWAQGIILFGERYATAPQGSVNVPDRLIPVEAQEPKEEMTLRYWKYVNSETGRIKGMFRQNTETKAFEMFGPPWLPAFKYYERVITEPDFEEIPEMEAKALIAKFD